jgi:hypothetical protein
MEPIRPVIDVDDLVHQWLAGGHLDDRLRTLRAQPTGGCNACHFADPLSDRLCTIRDISAEDFDLGVSGINCSRFEPYEIKANKHQT